MAQAAAIRPVSYRPSSSWPVVWMSVLLAIVTFLVMMPLTLMLLNNFQLARPGQPPVYGLDGWRQALTDSSMLNAMKNTVALSVTREGIALVLGVLLAWLIARTDMPWKTNLEFIFWVAFFL